MYESMREEMEDEMNERAEMMLVMLRGILCDSELHQNIAYFYSELMEELTTRGFSREEAMKVITSLPNCLYVY